MKFFLSKTLKILIFFILLLVISILLLKPTSLNFISNSISFNAKSKFILNNFIKYQEARIVVIGSSLALNNINAHKIQDSCRFNTMNLSSWGASFSAFQDFNIWRNRLIIIPISFADFHNMELKKFKGYPFTRDKKKEFLNIFLNYDIFISNCFDVIKSKRVSIFDYNSLNFDNCGSVLLSSYRFKIDSSRWNDDVFESLNVDSAKAIKFAKSLTELIKDNNITSKVVVCFLPARFKFYNKYKENIVKEIEKLIKDKCPETSFINNFSLILNDSCFADSQHFNKNGANLLTEKLITSLISSGVLDSLNFHSLQ